MNTINNRIVELRAILGLSQKAFGEPIGMSRDVIKNFEYNKTKPSCVQVSLICKQYNVREEWLVNGIGERFVVLSPHEEYIRIMEKVLSEPKKAKILTTMTKILLELPTDICDTIIDISRNIIINKDET